MQIELKTALDFVWKNRLVLWAEGDKLWAEGNKLWAEGNKLKAEGDKLWAEAVLSFCGNVTIQWRWAEGKQSPACELECGLIFEP